MEISTYFDYPCLRGWCHRKYGRTEGMKATALCPFWISPGQPGSVAPWDQSREGDIKDGFLNVLGTDLDSVGWQRGQGLSMIAFIQEWCHSTAAQCHQVLEAVCPAVTYKDTWLRTAVLPQLQEVWQISNEFIFKFLQCLHLLHSTECDFKEAQRLLQIIKVNTVALVFSQNQQKCN